MYTPPHFKESRPDVLQALIRQHSLAAIVAQTAQGLVANHIPVVFAPRDGTPGVLKGHIARANSLWKDLETGGEVLAIFQGASHYISPNWYPSKAEHGKEVPTWNYAIVHARGRVDWVHDAGWLREFVSTLTDRHESQLASPWHVTDAPAKYIDQMLAAIVGFEITITSLSGKWKLSQNHDAANRAGVVAGLTALADDAALEMARMVERAGETRGA